MPVARSAERSTPMSTTIAKHVITALADHGVTQAWANVSFLDLQGRRAGL